MIDKYQIVRNRVSEIVSSPGFQRYFYNTGWMFGEKLVRLIAGVFIGAYVARYLGPAQFGLFNYAISLTALFSAISTLGLDNIVIRELVKDEARTNRILGTAFILKLIGGLLSFLILMALAMLTESDRDSRLLVYVISAGAIFNSFGVIDFYFQSKVTSKFTVWSQLFSLILISALRIVFVVMNAPLLYFGVLAAMDFILLAIGLVFFFRKHGGSIASWAFDTSLARMLLLSSWPLIFSELATSIYMRFDQIMIRWLIGEEANGNYGVAVRLSEMWNFIPLAVCGSLFPAILNAKLQSEELYISRLKSLYRLMIILSLSIAIPMTFMSEWIVVLLFGEAYVQAGHILSIYIWSGLFIFIGVANGKWIITENMQKFRMVALCLSGVLNIALSFVLIKYIGIYGAAVSSLICYAFAGYFSFLLTKRTRPMFVHMTNSFNIFKLFSKDARNF